MLRNTQQVLKSQSVNALRKPRPHDYKYREMTRWQREAQGISKWDQTHSHRPRPFVHRFNPEYLGLTKGTSGFAWKWWYTQQPFLPQVPPQGYNAPKPIEQRPQAWDEDFTNTILSLSQEEVRQYALEQLTNVIFEETQRDGYELRRLDFESKPLTELPEPRIIEAFVFEEESLRERVIRRVVENVFRLSPTSTDRAELKTAENVMDFICAHVLAARPPPDRTVADKVKAILSQYHLQPRLGFVHALPQDHRDAHLVEWERLHQLDWQFGKAVYEPRSEENVRGNLVWMREALEDASREAFRQQVASGTARAEHLQKVAAAASR